MLSSLLLPLLILLSVTSWDTTIVRGSTSCAHDALCKIAPGHTDGFTCATSSTATPSACDILNALYDRWGAEAKLLSRLFKEVSQVLMFLAYILTIFVVYMVKYCQEARTRHQNQEFELIEQKLQANKAKRRAAAASAKSAPGSSQK